MSKETKGRKRRGDVSEPVGQTFSVAPLGKTKEWQEGYEASRRGVVRGRNPYGSPPTTQAGVDWQEGWIARFVGDHV